MLQRSSVPILIAVAFLGGCATEPAPAPVAPPLVVERYSPPPPPSVQKPVVRESVARPPVYAPPREERVTPLPAAPPPAPPAQTPRTDERPALTNAEIISAIIRDSLASYPGNCPCPDNVDRAGRRCGARSAYSRPGGYAPLCYPRDVSQAMIEAYRNRSR